MTDEDGTPIPPREEAAIARVRKRLFGTAPAWTDADRDVLQAVVHRIAGTESVSFSDGALRLAVLDIERRMYATQATNPRAANEPTPTGEPTESWEAWARREAPGDDSGECNEVTLRVRIEVALRNLGHLSKESEDSRLPAVDPLPEGARLEGDGIRWGAWEYSPASDPNNPIDKWVQARVMSGPNEGTVLDFVPDQIRCLAAVLSRAKGLGPEGVEPVDGPKTPEPTDGSAEADELRAPERGGQ